MKNFLICTLAITVFLGLNSCISNSYLPSKPYDENITISLRIDQPTYTRAVSNPIPVNTEPLFNTGDLFLVTSAGIIMEHFSIINGGVGVDANARTINRSCLTNGVVTIEGVPPSLRNGEVVIIGNTGINSNLANINHIGATVIDILNQSQFHLTSPSYGVNLFGSAPLTSWSISAGVETWSPAAPVRLAPTVARLEITNIVGMGNIESFSVEGVFIDNFYRLAHVNGTIPNDIPVTVPGATVGTPNLINNITLGRIFAYNTSGYPTAFNGVTFDWHAGGLPSAPVTINPHGIFPAVSPGTGNVWSYQLFARNTTTPPHIVFRLRDVQVRGEANPRPNPQFVTISDFVWHNDGSEVQGITAGNIYHIPANLLVFCERDLTAAPTLNATTTSTRVMLL
jgi:hypothetical protein